MAKDGRPYLHFRPDEELLSTVQKIASDNKVSLAHATRLLCLSGVEQYFSGNLEFEPVKDKRLSHESGKKIWITRRMKKKSGKTSEFGELNMANRPGTTPA